jgi:predicted dehydrogenase
MADKLLKIGLIGLDTSHAPEFTRLLNDEKGRDHVPGGRVVAAFPGGSPDMDVSRNRVEGFTKTLREKYSVEMKDGPEAVAEAVDLVMILSVDGRVHRSQFERTAKFKRPTFIDKPFAVSVEDAEAMLRLAHSEKIPLMSCSSVRYSDNVVEALGGHRENVLGCDAHGPLSEIPQQPGLFFYGVHTVDLIVSVMGHGCREVSARHYDACDVVTLAWPDGRVATARLMKEPHGRFGITLHRKAGAQFIDASAARRAAYASMLEAILRSLPQGKSDVPEDEMLDTIKLCAAANKSRETGQPVRLA